MPEAIQNILNRIRDWWNKFSTRQKIGIISAVGVVIVALIILGMTMNKVHYVQLVTADDTKQANSIKSALDGSDTTLDYKISDDGLTFYINSDQQSQARVLLGGADIATTGFTINDVVDGSFSTTEADKKKKYLVYLEDRMAQDLKSLENVDDARVNLNIPDDDGTLIANQLPSYGEAILTLNSEMSQAQAANLAHYMAINLGNDDTQNITIIDSNGNSLFSGGEAASSYAIAAQNRSVTQQAEAAEAEKVRNILANAGANNASVYDNLKVGVSLDANYDSTEVLSYDYSVDEGRDEGYIDSSLEETTETVNGVGGTPGTDANDDTSYVIQDGTNSSSSSSKTQYKRLPDETITKTTGEAGKVDKTNSSIGIVAYNYVIYREDVLKADGTLDGTTWDQYVAQNSAIQKGQVDQDVIYTVASATGIPAANITMLVYDVPFFEASESKIGLEDILEIVMALLILLLLFFVVFRTFRTKQEEEEEEEVSVETLLEEQPQEELEDIGYTEKSEARKLIEKFVDENPEAVASLLRNWLNEDWGG